MFCVSSCLVRPRPGLSEVSTAPSAADSRAQGGWRREVWQRGPQGNTPHSLQQSTVLLLADRMYSGHMTDQRFHNYFIYF